MKSLVELLSLLLQDCSRKCGAPVSRDLQTIRERVEHEGDSFITITLGRFCADLDRGLADGYLAPGSFASFRRKRESRIPEFLQGFVSRVFDARGQLRVDADVDCIRAIRQICLFGKKVVTRCTQQREAAAAEAYAMVDREVMTEPPARFWETYGLVGDLLMKELKLQNDGWEDDFVPRHGPGATRERISGNQKWVFRRWHMRLEMAGIKYWKYAKATSYPSYQSSNPLPEFVEPRNEEPVRVVFVPKTATTPRVIAVEPVCMQYAQQGLSRVLVHRVSRNRMTRKSILFKDQTVNGDHALLGSVDGSFATLDLKEASDRVGLVHVRTLFRSAPKFLEWMEACRSRTAQLPSGEILTLSKWASMGSALCFPIEAMVFYTITMACLIERYKLPVNERILTSLSGCVKVFGDDIIVPASVAPDVVEALQTLGLKVNVRKSFWTGLFRESCGVDAYGGEEVTPCYLRRSAPSDIKDVSGLLSWSATANQLEKAGYWRTALAMRKHVESFLGRLPEVPANSQAIGWACYSEYDPPSRWNSGYQRREYLCWVPSVTYVPDAFRGSEQALAKCFRLIGLDEPIDARHLSRSTRPYALTLKRKWVSFT